jgi:hypothetical protein
VVVTVLGMLAGACATGERSAPGALSEATSKPAAGSKGGSQRSGGSPPGPGTGAQAMPSSGPSTVIAQSGAPSDLEALGFNAFYYLNARVPKIVIEIDAVEGFEPKRSAVDLLVQRLGSVADKPGGVQVLPYGRLPGKPTWSVGDLAKADEKYRNAHSSASVAVIHILYVDGRSEEGWLGVAFRSGSAAIAIETLREGGLPTVPAEAVEKAAIVHEVGHLLSLVNIGYRSPRDHEDPSHPSHSKSLNSVMYHAVDDVGVYAIFRGLNRLPPTDFDGDDRADLADVKAGKLR